MLYELNTSKKYLVEKYGSENTVPSGTYAVPIQTSKGDSFMKVEITEDKSMKGFDLYKDESLTKSWHD